MRDYDDWKLDSGQDDEVVAFHCDHCNFEVYKGEEYTETTDGFKMHNDCFDEYARTYLIAYVGIAGEGE